MHHVISGLYIDIAPFITNWTAITIRIKPISLCMILIPVVPSNFRRKSPFLSMRYTRDKTKNIENIKVK